MEYKGWHSRGYLPHLDVPELCQFITFRTYGSFVVEESEVLRAGMQGTSFEWDEVLDQSARGQILKHHGAAEIVAETFAAGEKQGQYLLFSWAVMSNHVHLLLRPQSDLTVPQIVQGIKSVSSRKIKKLLGSKEPVWAIDYFDRYIRDENHFLATALYIERNPLRAGLGVGYPFVSRNYLDMG